MLSNVPHLRIVLVGNEPDQDPAEIRQYVCLSQMDEATITTQGDAEPGNRALHKKITNSHHTERSHTFLEG
jgi:hypothetical protein